MSRIKTAIFVASALLVAIALTGCSGSAHSLFKPSEKDFRAASDEDLTLLAHTVGKDMGSFDFAGYWDENKSQMKAGAKSACRTLAMKKAEALSQADLDVAMSMDQGYSRKQALNSESALQTAAYHHVCPQYDDRAGQLLAYLAVQIALED